MQALFGIFPELFSKVFGHVKEIIKFVSVCSTMHKGIIALLINSSSFSSWFLLKLLFSLLFKSKYCSKSQSVSAESKEDLAQRLFTVITVVYILV